MAKTKWQELAEQCDPGLHCHPWSRAFRKDLERKRPKLVADLSNTGSFGAYVLYHVDAAIKTADGAVATGSSPEAAHELAMQYLEPGEDADDGA